MEDLLAGFALSLRAKNRSPKTIHTYLPAAEQLATFLGTGDSIFMTTAKVERFTSHHPRASGLVITDDAIRALIDGRSSAVGRASDGSPTYDFP